jgi:hypothetical protein
MDTSTLESIAIQPAEVEFEYVDAPAAYICADAEMVGTASVHATRQRIRAELAVDKNLFSSIAARGGGSFSFDDFSLRSNSPGKLLDQADYGRIVPENADWEATKATNDGVHGSLGADRSVYRFAVQEFLMRCSARDARVAAVRRVMSGSELSVVSTLAGRTLIAHPLTTGASNPEDQMLSVTSGGMLDEVQEHVLWIALSFISGNRLSPLFIETFDDRGILIERKHRRGAGVSHGRNAPFERFDAPINSRGFARIGDGFIRLLRAAFPIANVVHHLTEANTNNLDLDGQHLRLAIHAAIEAWNRLFGFKEWIDDEVWDQWFRSVRKYLLRPVLEPAYQDLGVDVVANLWNTGRHANRTTTAWRQQQLFSALQIQVQEEDSQRVLKMRDELLHNGFFLVRFQDLSHMEQQQRFDDIARLRNLAHIVVLRLAAFEGVCFDFLSHGARSVAAIPLPAKIADQPLG